MKPIEIPSPPHSARLQEGREVQARIINAFKDRGMRAFPFGSMVTGKVHDHSDADVLVAGNVDPIKAFLIAEKAANGFPFDVVVWECIDPEYREFILQTMKKEDIITLISATENSK